jgi:hypothetical protein
MSCNEGGHICLLLFLETVFETVEHFDQSDKIYHGPWRAAAAGTTPCMLYRRPFAARLKRAAKRSFS